MANIYPENWMTHEEALKEDNDRRQSVLMYWQRLRGARVEYATEIGVHPQEMITKGSGFYEWMEKKYGVKLEFIDGNISGAYTVTDKKKLTMFLLKYPG